MAESTLVHGRQLNLFGLELFDLRDKNNRSTELFRIDYFTTVEDVINKLNRYLGIEVEDECDSLYTSDSGTDYNYVYVANDGDCFFVKSLDEFNVSKTEKDWRVETKVLVND